jgi:TIR domain
MDERRPMAFMSYAHVDDEFNKGRLTEFSQCLSREVSLHLGDDFPIFLDRKDIKWGDSWKERIGESIDCTTFLIPIITPSFFNSNYCRDELNRFLDRERKLGRNDLILPVYFIHTSLLHDESKRNGDNLAQTIASRQYADWRKLRHKKFDSEEVCEALDNLATQIREALESLPPASEEHALKSESPTPVRNKNRPSAAVIKKEIEKIRHAAPKSEASTIVVDQIHRGDFATISEAISAADPGSRILVKSGIYHEGLVLDKPLEIVGDGEIGEVVIRASGKNTILFQTVRGKISNLLIRQTGGGNWFGVNISQGCLELDRCDITSDSLGVDGR